MNSKAGRLGLSVGHGGGVPLLSACAVASRASGEVVVLAWRFCSAVSFIRGFSAPQLALAEARSRSACHRQPGGHGTALL